MFNDEIIIIKEGQLVTGRRQLSEMTGISQTTIERILKVLENGHQIGQQKTTKFRLITIVNWKEYQNADIKMDNKRTTKRHIQECNNEKNNTLSAEADEPHYSVCDDEGNEVIKKEPNRVSEDIKKLCGYYVRKYEALSGKKPMVNIAAISRLGKNRMSELGYDRMALMLDEYFNTDADMLRDGGYDLKTFFSSFWQNKLNLKI